MFTDTCTSSLFKWIANEGKIEGRIEGRARGIVESCCEFNLSEDDILKRLQQKLDITLPKAQEYFEMFRPTA